MTTTKIHPAGDLFSPYEPHQHPEDARYYREKKVKTAVRLLVAEMAVTALEDNPADHRTGFFTCVLDAMADAMITKRGWSPRDVADALIMEAVRAAGRIEDRTKAEARKRWEARQGAKAVRS